MSTTTTFFGLLLLFAVFGIAEGNYRPAIIVSGMALMWWYTASASMIVVAANEIFPIVERFVHPTTYVSLPICGMFFLNGWLPNSVRKYILLFPPPHITEFIRTGVFEHLSGAIYDLKYVVMVSAIQTFIGYLSLRIIRRRVHL
jgi:capsular polysaccharide transport system permease protein